MQHQKFQMQNPKQTTQHQSITHSTADIRSMFALDAGRLGSILSRVKPKTLILVSTVTLAKRSAIKCSVEDEIYRE